MTELEEDWNWMIQSLTKYKDLHMYALSQPTDVLEWTDQTNVFVAGNSSSNHRYEALVLSLPTKLTNTDDENDTLSKDRDFKIFSGGFHNQPILSMSMISDRHFVTSSPSHSNEICTWNINNDDDDVIAQLSSMKGQSSHQLCAPQIAANPNKSHQVARASSLEDLEVVDLESGKNLWSNKIDKDLSQPIASIDFVSSECLLVSNAMSGQLYSMDIRTPAPVVCSLEGGSNHAVSSHSVPCTEFNFKNENNCIDPARWNCSVNFLSRHKRAQDQPRQDAQRLVARLSLDGNLIINDFRDLENFLHNVSLSTGPHASNSNKLCVKWSPQKKNLVSVSGFDSCIHIYDISTFDNSGDGLQSVKPLFVYDGHTTTAAQESQTCVTSHLWHQNKSNLILSSGGDGSLHAWNWHVP